MFCRPNSRRCWRTSSLKAMSWSRRRCNLTEKLTLHVRKDVGLDQSATDDDAVTDEDDPSPPLPEQPTGQLRLSAAGAKLIQAFESCARRSGGGGFGAYSDAVGV